MISAAPVARLTGFAIAFVAASCGGERIRLGDAPDATIVTAGSVGQGGETAASGGFGGSTAASGGAGTCDNAPVNANEVLWIGDTWVTIPGNQHTRVRDFARASGAIGPDEDYAVLAAPFASMEAIAVQYETQQTGPTEVKVLIMDGGTWDTIVANGSDASINATTAMFAQLLAKVASDGTVQHIVYFLVPELPMIPGVAGLRPEVQRACAESIVPCHFLDLQPIWAGHPEYTSSDGVQASEAGGSAIADAIWAIMQQSCIAQ
jgi:hypothetical protein